MFPNSKIAVIFFAEKCRFFVEYIALVSFNIIVIYSDDTSKPTFDKVLEALTENLAVCAVRKAKSLNTQVPASI